ncbi:putative TIR domain, P-loop containing nucleoside triphosphate hydrolase [Helianthus annuus]|uniref:TIR domain, P-loop containing nucleoside triphosphate hydrolase n=2 Tax=Helianthus annuus TaxID=4232 RepID=A0A9K3NXH3_HELAN|nr:disease resistance protein RPV1 [Helianthus annuus]XP_022028606.1 disease resistance protein RPV1 [Helianthus annuus]KAF5815048.1 putative TIR domain, P-loop containing nucleoside triphosphate hydrolase [Helianthus annuus]KAJ0944303.1 putative TIR domain, P-loop containing nucleoside triphosphate hydrolase [Helianthus annuus]
MASTSASSIQKSFKYDVFLSFRGEDTRKNFVDHLYHALTQKGISTYRDDEEIKKGEKISDELIRSIKDSKFYIIVFSKNYASSSWCLDELVKIMECQKTNEHTAFPVFYDVEPTEVRKQSGPVEKAFEKHKEEESAEKWKKALREAADLAGWELKNIFDGHEAKLITKMVEEISLELRFTDSSVDGKLVGMETRVKDVVSSLDINIEDHVRMIGIWGMGGAGKTTLARAVFDQISFRFEGSSFVGNVREMSGNPRGLKSLQKQVLSDVLNDPNIIVNGASDMKRMMRGRKVLVVLDDVDHIDQLEALAGEPNWFNPGSRVIITTREEQVLVAHGVPNNLILHVNLLSREEANCLFNRYAFRRLIPNQGYEELACQVIHYAAGLPLTIKVLGSFLRGKDELEWRDALDRLKTIPLKETLKILEVSYDGLEEDYKEIFLDVACILKGWKKEKAIRALESCGFHARSGLKVLEQKSLITVTRYGNLDMHDHIEEMGKNIVRRLHPNEPHRHSRLWIKEEIEDILVNNKGTKAIRCIKLLLVNLSVAKEGLQKMRGLRFLEMDHRCDGDCECKDIGEDNICLPNGLRYLSLYNYPFKCFPKNFQPNNLVGLQMLHSNVDQHWEVGEKVLKNLRFIDLWNCGSQSLNIGLSMNLEWLNLYRCNHLVELHMPVESLKLKSLRLINTKLKTLNLKGAQNLEILVLEKCEDLVELDMPIECLMLERFHLSNTKLKTLNLKGCRNLERLEIEQCEDLVELKVCRNLETLNIYQCEDLVELEMPAESLMLKSLHLGNTKLKTLNLKGAQNLQKLDVKQCEDLVELDMPVESSLMLKRLHLGNAKLKTLNLKGCWNLETLDLEKCEDLVELHMPVESLILKTLHLCTPKLKTLNLKGARNLEKLDVEQCEELIELNLPVESLELKCLSLQCCKVKTLNLKGTRNLETLYLNHCEDLVELHMPIESLNLKLICLRYNKLKTLNLKGTRNLEMLDLEQCEDLVELHMPVESFKLRSFNICCSKLRTLDLGLTPNLEELDLKDCYDLVEVHVPVGCLKKVACSNLSGWVMFAPLLVNQGFPEVDPRTELILTVTSLDTSSLHPDINLPKFQLRCVYNESLLSPSGNLGKLISFGLCGCTSLASLSGSISLRSICGLQCLKKLTLEGFIPEVPNELDQLEFLEELTLSSTKIKHLPDRICMLKRLKLLRFKSCWLLEQLPEDLGRLECLEELYLTECLFLRDIPNSICEMKRLKCFHLPYCVLVEKLPEEIGRINCLKELNIEGTGIKHLPQSTFQLKGLRILGSRWQLESYDFTSVTQISEYMAFWYI